MNGLSGGDKPRGAFNAAHQVRKMLAADAGVPASARRDAGRICENAYRAQKVFLLDPTERVPDGKLIVTESGISTAADVKRMISRGIYGFLIGETFMRARNPGDKLRELFAG